MKYKDYKAFKNKVISIQGELDRIQTHIMEEAGRLTDIYEELEYVYNYVISCVEVEPDEEHQGYSYPQKGELNDR